MNNWYKKAQRSRMIEPDMGTIIEGPGMSELTPTKIEEIKLRLEKKHPNINWTLKRLMKWINDNFIGKTKPWTGPKDELHYF